MEVPTTAAYVICVSVAGPALIELGMEPLQAHLFVFWYALLSTITPPVCGAVFIAAGMAGENWLRVSMVAMALGIGLDLHSPGHDRQSGPDPGWRPRPPAALVALVKTGLALAAISAGVIRPLPIAVRAALVAVGAAVLLIPMPGWG
ncbi:MAG: TRAP transporter large permease subunit [Halofilum sp. (in: g-proteobacteria)]|nr:TRAP transporter large permease subunit [Halofilum sp. (in: g-proteobacteria)]